MVGSAGVEPAFWDYVTLQPIALALCVTPDMVRVLGVEPSISRVQGGHHTPQSNSDNMVRIGSAALPASESQTQRSANMSYILIYGSSDRIRTCND